MKKILCKILSLFLCLCICFSFSGCESNKNYRPKEVEHLYWKDIDVEVIDIKLTHWFAITHRYVLNITVYSEEYDLEETFEYHFQGPHSLPDCAESKEGDIVKAELFSWVLDSTGEVTKREIHKVY